MEGAKSSDHVAFDATQRTEHQGAAPGPRLPRGAQVGRYLVLDEIGAGGMGVVYSAYDPELDRKVAIKLVQAGSGGSVADERTWMLREAQALARLSHPNVVAVHDVGTFETDRVFVAMEHVAGMTLRVWLERAHRSWREVVPVMLAAGAGLAAAHAVGLVHRDFKPDNIIVGDDGRVRVMDFGLARLRRDGFDADAARASDASIDVHSPLSQQLTVKGAIVGTPAYLAPEIYAGTPADARSDQYAFGVAMYFALWRAVPYDLQAVVEGTAKPPKPPAEPAVPARIQRVVLRAIAIKPEDRYESLEALARELEAAIAPRRRAALAIAGAVAVLGAGTLLAVSHSANEPCSGSEQRLAGAWDATTRQALRTAYLATKLPYADRAATALDGALDHYAREWVTMASESCKATRVRRDQTETVMSLRQACLDQRLGGLRALVRELADHPADAVVAKAEAPAHELPSLAPCADTDSLLRPDRPPADPRVAQTQELLANSNAQLIATHYMAAMVSSQKGLELADAIGYAPLRAAAHRARAIALIGVQNTDDGMTELVTGANLALAAKDDDLAAQNAFFLAMFDAQVRHTTSEAKIWLGIGLAEQQRVAPNDQLEFLRYTASGVVAAESGDPVTAVAEHKKLIDIANRMDGPNGSRMLAAELHLAASCDRASLNAEAIEHYRKAIALAERVVGPDHPDSAILHSNLATSLGRMGRTDESRAEFAHALELFEKGFGPNNPVLALSLNNMADAMNINGDPAGALPISERAMKLALILGNENPAYHTAATTRGEILAHLHRLADARTQFDELIPIEERVHSIMLPTTLASRADLALVDKSWAEAADFARRSIDAFEAAGGKDNPELWRPLGVLGRAEIQLGKLDDARRDLDRALAIAGKVQLAPALLEPVGAARASLR